MSKYELNKIIDCPDNLMKVLKKYSEKKDISLNLIFSFLLFVFLYQLEKTRSEAEIIDLLDSAFCGDVNYMPEKKNGGDLH